MTEPADIPRIETRVPLDPAAWLFLEHLANKLGTTIPLLVAELVRRGLPEDYEEQVDRRYPRRLKVPRPRPVLEHGTRAGYQAGCRGTLCPNKEYTCSDDNAVYQREHRVNTATDNLTPAARRKQEQRDTVNRMLDESKSVQEIADALGMNVRSAYRTIKRIAAQEAEREAVSA